MSARRPPMLRLIITATVIALLASCTVGYIVLELSRDAASDTVVMQPLLMFAGSCFVLAWPGVFLAGWLMLRSRERG